MSDKSTPALIRQTNRKRSSLALKKRPNIDEFRWPKSFIFSRTRYQSKMLWATRMFRDRMRLRLNNDRQSFRWYNIDARRWQEVGNECTGSHTAALVFDMDGRRMKLASHTGYAQCILLVNTRKENVIGYIQVSKDGALRILDAPTFSFDWPLPEYWQERATAIVGIDGPFTANVSDCAIDDEDIIRLKEGKKAIFVPARYAKATAAYDYTHPVNVATPSGVQIERYQSCLSLVPSAHDPRRMVSNMNDDRDDSVAVPTRADVSESNVETDASALSPSPSVTQSDEGAAGGSNVRGG